MQLLFWTVVVALAAGLVANTSWRQPSGAPAALTASVSSLWVPDAVPQPPSPTPPLPLVGWIRLGL